MSTLDQSPSAALPSPLHPWPPRGFAPQAVVFDCDGLLVDTESAWIAVQEELLTSRGQVMDSRLRRTLTGAAPDKVVRALGEILREAPEVIARELTERLAASSSVPPAMFPGAERTVRAAAARVPIAIASNSPRQILDRLIEQMGIGDLLSTSVALEDVAAPKPAPDMYALAARRLGADPGRTLALEDSETGARSARDAGLLVIAVPSQSDQDPECDLRLDSLDDDGLHAWIDAWGSAR